MVIVFQADRNYCGFSVDRYNRVVGLSLGFISIHVVLADIDEFVDAWRHSRGEL